MHTHNNADVLKTQPYKKEQIKDTCIIGILWVLEMISLWNHYVLNLYNHFEFQRCNEMKDIANKSLLFSLSENIFTCLYKNMMTVFSFYVIC